MTKKDFILVARTVNEAVQPLKTLRQIEKSAKYDQSLATLRSLAERMCYEFKINNPRFDQGKFISACGF